MTKTIIYFLPGLAAGPEIFEYLKFNTEKYELHYLKWIAPLTINESITNYAKRLNTEIKTCNCILIGVSFGGILVQEMHKLNKVKKVIIISSVKTDLELPIKFKIAKFTNIHKLFPTKLITNFENYTKYFIGTRLQRKATTYKKYLSVRDKNYLKWSINCIINWEEKKQAKNVIHIHGTKDTVFPIKNIHNAIAIQKGTHSMILTHAKLLTTIIENKLTLIE